MNFTELLAILFPPRGPKQLTRAQEAIIRHPGGAAWVLAGPGSGKTEVLTILVLRLLYVEGDPIQAERVPPESIFLTTFTEKAARNLEDRLSHYRAAIVAAHPELATVDISRLRLGTLHGLSNDLLQELRAANYQNVRLMDDFEQGMFIYEHMSIVDAPDTARDHPFWTEFGFLFATHEWQPRYANLPSKWNQAGALARLFNRIVEDRVSIDSLRNAGGQWQRLADLYEEYRGRLATEHRCDFSHLQLRFLEFLGAPIGQRFRNGQLGGRPGIRWVMVDEYQDTNLIQEEIYLTLANVAAPNIVVVGDDDQAMYRFRGGSVECMVTFDHACEVYLGIPRGNVRPYPLVDNFRSHPGIVTFCNDYITAFEEMQQPGARVPNKPALNPRSAINGAYPAVGQLRARTIPLLADRFADTVRDLVANGVVRDYNQCCLLLKSTRETPHNAAPYVDALRSRGIPVYNPRNKAYLEQEEVQGLLGGLLAILDPNGRLVPPRPTELAELIIQCRAQFDLLAPPGSPLRRYVNDCTANLAAHPGSRLSANLQEILFYLLAQDPFSAWQNDPVRRVRMGRITALLESFASMPDPRFWGSRGSLRASNVQPGEVHERWCQSFYHLFFGYLAKVGLNEDEDEEVICPPGMLPIMTMHQSKGLQFPFTFVGHMGETTSISADVRLETMLSRFPNNPARAFARVAEADRAKLDLIRRYYVAYSRAQYALILMGTDSQVKKNDAVPCGPNAAWLRNNTPPL